MPKAIVVFSGGPDSTAAAIWAKNEGLDPTLLTIQYRGREQYGELRAAMLVASELKLPHSVLNFQSPMDGFSPLVHIMMHAGTKEGLAESKEEHLMPFGAGMVLGVVANYALYRGFDSLVWGATKADASSGNFQYGAQFANEFAALISKATRTSFEIFTPFSNKHKHEIIGEYFRANEDLFAKTWSCKRGGPVQSGDCHASIARRIAAELAGIRDFTEYASSTFAWPAGLPRGAAKGKVDEPTLLGATMSNV